MSCVVRIINSDDDLMSDLQMGNVSEGHPCMKCQPTAQRVKVSGHDEGKWTRPLKNEAVKV